MEKKYEYKVEKISGNLQEYLNKQSEQGWRCVSTMTNTGLGWTITVVLEKIIDTIKSTD